MAERLIRLTELRHRIPYSRASIYRLMAANQFPQHIAMGGRAVAWRESDIDAWIASRIAVGSEGQVSK